jgi:Ca2+-transporting ATPase
METSSEHSVDDVLAALQTNAQSGLSDGDARSRLDQYGRNQLTAEKPLSKWRKFFAQLTSMLVVLLLVAALVSAAFWFYERDSPFPYESMAISAIVLLNAIMGYIQEARAEQALIALR